MEHLKELFTRLKDIELHYARKENQLFPVLESKGFNGPTRVMWGKHDEIRAMMREIDRRINEKQWAGLILPVQELTEAIKKLIFLEEKILFPTSEKKISSAEWARIKKGEPEIGYAWITPSNLWDAQLAEGKQPLISLSQVEVKTPATSNFQLSQGALTPAQINLMLKNLPVDITYVDENDRVCYYSDTTHRIFPRSPAIIGRAVQNCHPPKSVHIVNDILQSFREKKKSAAEFWIQMGGQFIHIRYFPLYDESGAYKGVVEISQEVSGIRRLEGEKRLLDW